MTLKDLFAVLDGLPRAAEMDLGEQGRAIGWRLRVGHACACCGRPAVTALYVMPGPAVPEPRWLDACAPCAREVWRRDG